VRGDKKRVEQIWTLSASRDGGTDGGHESRDESEKEPTRLTPELVVSSGEALYLDDDMVIHQHQSASSLVPWDRLMG
jgi:hypothetical protein